MARGVGLVIFAAPTLDRNGRVVGAMNILAPAPDHAQSMGQNRRLAAIVEDSGDAIISKTLDGIVTTWNLAATRIFGFTADEMINQSIARIIPEELMAQESDIIARLKRGERVDHFDTIRLTKSGRRLDVSITISPFRDETGRVVGASKIVREVTDRKQVELKLLEAAAAAENANRAKTDFLATMSHEIRTPLNSIAGFVDLLATVTELTPVQRRYTDLVRTANAALLVIVNDILDFSKVEAGQLELHPRPFSLLTLVRDTVAIVMPAAAAKDLRLICRIEPGAPETVMGDHGRLRQVLLNLLNNAVKFTSKGSITLEVRKQTAAGETDFVRFSVADTGIGVPEDQHARLFKKFSQADSSDRREHGGTGLGLAICKQLVELMGGKIGIVSEAGEGATVWFDARLPQTQLPIPESRLANSLRRAGASRARILVVDDIETNIEIIEVYLHARHYQVEHATSGLEAIRMLGLQHYDLVLMDVQMPVMDGVTATQRIRELPSPVRDIPIIAMTANVLPVQIRSFLDAGMNGHLAKPIEWESFDDSVLRWLPKKQFPESELDAAATDFNRDKFVAFVNVVGHDKAESLANNFLASLETSFKATPLDTQQEANGLISVASVLGLEFLVESCRAILKIAVLESAEASLAEIQGLLGAQARAVQILQAKILPELRGGLQSDVRARRVADKLLLALVQMEYAAADFFRRKTSTSDTWKRADLDAMLPNFEAAAQALRLALDALGGKIPHRRIARRLRRARADFKGRSEAMKTEQLSPNQYVILAQLRRGCAFEVRGSWRFRGLRHRVPKPWFLSLVAKGLAESVQTERFLELHITPAGLAAIPNAASAPTTL